MHTIFAWFVFQSALGSAFAVLIYRDDVVAFSEALLLAQICVHCISSPCAIVLTWRARSLMARTPDAGAPAGQFARAAGTVLPWTLTSAVFASLPAAAIAVRFFSSAIYGTPFLAFAGIAAVSVIFAAVITVVYIRLRWPSIAGQSFSSRSRPGRGLWIREGQAYVQIPLETILVLAAHKHATMLHTTGGDYRAPEGLGRILARLRASDTDGRESRFVQVHRSFVLNADRVVRFEAVDAGQYRATLGDAHETEVPVGRRYASELRRVLGLHSIVPREPAAS